MEKETYLTHLLQRNTLYWRIKMSRQTKEIAGSRHCENEVQRSVRRS